jgi:patatin-like phospholipase/acyl hydrolase
VAKPYRILSCDGGGIRGLLTLQLLKRLLAVHPTLVSEVDLFAGTSTGGLIALGLAHGLTVSELEKLYLDHGKAIFKDTLWDDIKDLGQLVGAEYSLDTLIKVCKGHFGATTLGQLGVRPPNQLTPRRVVISAFDLDAENATPRRWKPKFFHNLGGADSDDAVTALDAAIATSAAPTYFPAYKGYIDGGVVAGNPSMAALVQALDARVPLFNRAESLADIRVLSLGTGTVPNYVKGSPDWGEAQWIKPIIELMLEGSISVPDFQCRALLGAGHYRRVNPFLPEKPKIPMDSVDHMPLLVELGQKADLKDTAAWLSAGWSAP